MKCTRFSLFASIALAIGCLAPHVAFGADKNQEHRDDSSSKKNQQDEQDERDEQSNRKSDDDETEYRGMEHAALGVMLSERAGQGVRIRDLMEDSPADQAGLRAGDRITKIDDQPMQSYRDVIRFINHVKPGQKSEITINRDGDEKTLDVRFASQDEIFGNDNNEQWENSQNGSRRYENSNRRQNGQNSNANRGQNGNWSQYGNGGQSGNRSQYGNQGQAGNQHQYENQGQYGNQYDNRRQYGSQGQYDDQRHYGNQQQYDNQRQNGYQRQYGNQNQNGRWDSGGYASQDQYNQSRGANFGQYGRTDEYGADQRQSGRQDNGQFNQYQSGQSYAQNQQRYSREPDQQWNRSGRNQSNWSDENSNRRNYTQRNSNNHGLLGIDLDERRGVVTVRDVWEGSPAEQAGLRRGDEIVSLDGEDVDDPNDLVRKLENYQPGERLKLTVSRDGEDRTVRARLASPRELSNSRQNDRYQNRDSQWDDSDGQRSASRPRLRQAQRGQRESWSTEER